MKNNFISSDVEGHCIVSLDQISSINPTTDKLTIQFHRRGGWVCWDFESVKEQEEYYQKIKDSQTLNITNMIKFE